MSKKVKQVFIGIAFLFLVLVLIECAFMFGKNENGERDFAIYIPFAIMAVGVLLTASTLFGLWRNKDFFFKLGIMGGFIGVIGVAIYETMVLTGVMAMLGSATNLEEFVRKTGVWGPLIYILIQAAQVTLIPIPSTITVIAGMAIFSMVEVVIYSTVGMIIGSVIAFSLGRIFGVKLVVWLVGEKSFNRYQKIIKGRDKTMLFMMFLLPVFPDDLLCLLAGITTMSFGTFFAMQIISRPIGICMSSLGGLMIKIPFEGWYIALWVFFILFIVLMFVFVWKYSGKIEDKIVKGLVARMSLNSGTTIDKSSLKVQVANLVSDTQVVSNEVKISKRRRKQLLSLVNDFEPITFKYTINYDDSSDEAA